MDTEGNTISNFDVEELASLARRYYGARFPNPERLGCPPPGEIIKVVRQRQIPDEALREHLFECSECFGEYRQSLAQCRGPATFESVWRNQLASIMSRVSSSGALKISAAAISAVLILSSLIILIWPKVTSDSRKAVATDSAPSTSRTGDVARDSGGAAADTGVPGGVEIPKPADDLLAMAGVGLPSTGAGVFVRPERIDVDLENFQVFRQSLRAARMEAHGERPSKGSKLRGNAAMEMYRPQPGEGANIISLPPTRARIVLRLPETAAPGIYKVSLINAFGKSLLSTSAVSHDGYKLQVALDLRRISPKKCRLRLGRDGEAPAFYDVIIAAR
jgi:hypothetical protein